MICVTAVYPNREGSHFDIDDYTKRHAAHARKMLTPHGLVELRIMAGVVALDGAPPPIWVIAEMRFRDRAAFDAGMAACGAALFADAANYTDVEPILQIASLVPDQEP